jgi:hypothetical protein
MKTAKIVAIGIAAVILVAGSVFRVREGEQVIITQFGEPHGKPIVTPGLYSRIPFVQKANHFKAAPASEPSFENSLVITPLSPQYLLDSEDKFRKEANELKRGVGSARYVMLGFAAGIGLSFPDSAPALAEIDEAVRRAKANGLVVHISLSSGFFHGWNALRERAIQDDVRNAQWFADGLIAPAADLTGSSAAIPRSVWITPSRYALSLRPTIEQAVRVVGAHLAQTMQRDPETLVTVSGDGEVEYTYERSFGTGAEGVIDQNNLVYTDYSPFMVAEFRDSLKKNYAGDRSPATDEGADGHTFNKDFGTDFETWDLKYYDHSGSIPFAEYVGLKDKLPKSGPNFIEHGFDAPREPRPSSAFWNAWLHFRRDVLRNWVRDFATWITTSPDPASGFTIPSSRYYTHQIPADFLFGKSDNLRLKTSASVLETALIDPLGSSGVTAFNVFTGRRHAKTASPALFSPLFRSADHWGVLEYNPSVPQSDDDAYYLGELRQLYAYRPHLIVPFAWSDAPDMKKYSIKGSAFERALNRFIAEVGQTPWFSLRPLIP